MPDGCSAAVYPGNTSWGELTYDSRLGLLISDMPSLVSKMYSAVLLINILCTCLPY